MAPTADKITGNATTAPRINHPVGLKSRFLVNHHAPWAPARNMLVFVAAAPAAAAPVPAAAAPVPVAAAAPAVAA